MLLYSYRAAAARAAPAAALNPAVAQAAAALAAAFAARTAAPAAAASSTSTTAGNNDPVEAARKRMTELLGAANKDVSSAFVGVYRSPLDQPLILLIYLIDQEAEANDDARREGGRGVPGVVRKDERTESQEPCQ